MPIGWGQSRSCPKHVQPRAAQREEKAGCCACKQLRAAAGRMNASGGQTALGTEPSVTGPEDIRSPAGGTAPRMLCEG